MADERAVDLLKNACDRTDPSTPIEVLFQQLDDGITFAPAGEEILSSTRVIRTGYTSISSTNPVESGTSMKPKPTRP